VEIPYINILNIIVYISMAPTVGELNANGMKTDEPTGMVLF
jgi:hypothetical protein